MTSCETCIHREVCKITSSSICMYNCPNYYYIENKPSNISDLPLLYSMTTGDNFAGKGGDEK